MDLSRIKLALTFDDVLLVPQRSRVQSRKQVDTTAQLTSKIRLRTPLISSNMDSVSGVKDGYPAMCIEMARHGGVGILHRFMSVDEMVAAIRKVKRAESPVIHDPCTVKPDMTVGQVVRKFRELGITGAPVVEDGGMLRGMLTRRDLLTATDEHQFVSEVMVSRGKLVVASPGVSTEEAKRAMIAARVEKLPLVDAADILQGMITMRDINNLEHYPLATKDEQGRLVVGAAVGVRGDYLERARACEEAGVDFLCLDIAHGHAEHALIALQELTRTVSVEIIAGNVATAEGARDLIQHGASAVKCGVGNGSTCITRLIAGTGLPSLEALSQASAICAEAGIPLIADGGIRTPGDVAKAIAVGADTVMIGNLLAGTDESPGELLKRNGRLVKVHRGMASAGAAQARKQMEINAGREEPTVEQSLTLDSSEGVSGGGFGQTTPEGVEATVPYSGPAADVLAHLVGGLRSAMSYSDSLSIEEFHTKAQFVRITNAGLIESHPHDVEM